MKSSLDPLYFNTFDQRIALARRRYFEEGEAPSGVVDNAIFESWSRCQRRGANPGARPEFNEVTNSRVQLAKQRNYELIAAWSTQVDELGKTLAGTSCSAVLTDATGVLIACIGEGDDQTSIIHRAHRVGVNLSEEAVGTNAPALALKTGRMVAVNGGEHFFQQIGGMHCVAAPIRNTRGTVAAVLNIAREGAPFNFHAPALVSLYAALIENRYLAAHAIDHMTIRVQLDPSLLNTPFVGLLGCSFSGEVIWQNRVAEQLLGLANHIGHCEPLDISSIFGMDTSALLEKSSGRIISVRSAAGLSMWMQVVEPSSGGPAQMGTSHDLLAAKPHSVPSERIEPLSDDKLVETNASLCSDQQKPMEAKASASLRECDQDLVLQTVNKHDGNISKAARELRVSRGLIYRRLKLEKTATVQRVEHASCSSNAVDIS